MPSDRKLTPIAEPAGPSAMRLPPAGPIAVRVSDITRVRILGSWLYLAVIRAGLVTSPLPHKIRDQRQMVRLRRAVTAVDRQLQASVDRRVPTSNSPRGQFIRALADEFRVWDSCPSVAFVLT